MLRPVPALTPEIAALLGRAMFLDPARVARTLEAYRTEPDRLIFVWDVGHQPVSAAGVRVTGREAEVLHIGTQEELAGNGYGRNLILAIAAHLNLSRLIAETDDDSVGFYSHSGFEIAEAADKGGGRRFRCVLSLAE